MGNKKCKVLKLPYLYNGNPYTFKVKATSLYQNITQAPIVNQLTQEKMLFQQFSSVLVLDVNNSALEDGNFHIQQQNYYRHDSIWLSNNICDLYAVSPTAVMMH